MDIYNENKVVMEEERDAKLHKDREEYKSMQDAAVKLLQTSKVEI